MYNPEEIKTVHFEITTKCNARCPQCPRNICGGNTISTLPLVELTLEDCKKILPIPFIKQLEKFYMCGNYGDAIVAKDTLEIFEYLRSNSKNLILILFTNGSAKSKEWWQSLARTFCEVKFAIDGLEDTNSIYRRGTKWSTIMNSASNFINEGGKAEWVYIVFKHNEHQVEEAEKLSKDLGFDKFTIKRTTRFSNSASGTKIKEVPVYNFINEIEYYLSPPVDEKYQIQLTRPWEQPDQYSQYLSSTEISCRAVKEKMIYITAEGFVLPCCWLANFYQNDSAHNNQISKIINDLPYKLQTLNSKKNSIEEIIKCDLFQKIIPNYWTPSNDIKSRLRVCAQTCGDCSIKDNQVIKTNSK